MPDRKPNQGDRTPKYGARPPDHAAVGLVVVKVDRMVVLRDE
jgi:hypothetical protein